MYKKLSFLLFLLINVSFNSFAQTFSVTTNGGSGLSLTYSSLANAITALNSATITSPVVITCAAGDETAPAGGFVIEAVGTNVNTIVIQGAGGTSSTIKAPNPAGTPGALNDALIKLRGADFITIEGFNLTENPLNTTIASATNNMVEWGIALLYKSLTDGSQNNTIQNNTILLNRTYQNTFGIYSNTRHSSTAPTTSAEVTAATGSNSFNRVYGNSISNVKFGIVFIGAGTTIAAIDDGNDVGGSSASTGNSITDWGNALASSGYISLTGNNFCVFLNQQINDNVRFNTVVSAALTSNTTVGGIFKNYSIAAPLATSTFTSNYNNNTVTVTNTPSAAGGTIIGIVSQGIGAVVPNATINILNNTVKDCSIGGTLATTAGITCISNTSAVGTVNIQDNIINNNSITSPAATTAILAAITNNGATASTGKLFITGNTVTNMSSSAATGQMQGIVNGQPVTSEVNILNNQLGNATSNFFLSNVNSAGVLFGIVTSGGTNTCALNIIANNIQGISYSANPTATQIFIQNSATTLSQTIEDNTFTDLSIKTIGSVQFINNNVSLLATGVKNINNNSIVGSFAKTAAGGFVRFYGDFGSTTPTGAVINNNNNDFSNITVTVNTLIAGWVNQDGADPSDSGTKTFTNNTFNNINGGNGNVVIANFDWGLSNTITNNSFTNITVQDTIFVMLLGVNNNGLNVSGNEISNINSTGSSGWVIGLAAQGSLNQPASVSNNIISSITNAGLANTTGLYLVDTIDASKNIICDISGTNPSAVVRGIQIFGKSLISNNKISNLQATTASNTNAIRGIHCEVTSETKIYYNSINLNATSTGTDFGSSAVFVDTGAIEVIMNNNIFSNQSTPNGSGLSAAYRRSGNNLTNYANSSNRNDFFAPTIFTDGTNTFSAVGPGAGTYIDFVSPRDANSFSDNPTFLNTACDNPDFLKIDGSSPSLVNNSGASISSVADDFDGDIRSLTTPDVGADEVSNPCSLTVTSSLDSGAGSLRSAVACAVTGNTITIDPAVTNIILATNLDIVGKSITIVSTAGVPPMLSFDSNTSALQVAAAAGLTLNNIHIKDTQTSIVNPVVINNGAMNLLASKVTGTTVATVVKVNNNPGATMSVDSNSSITNQ